MFSTGFNSGARAGSSTSVRLSGTTRSLARCHPARSISMTPWAPGATACATSARCRVIAGVSHRGRTRAAPLPCCGQTAPKMSTALVLWSCGARGRVPRRAQRRAILVFWPTRASSCHHSSRGVPFGRPARIVSKVAGRFFKKLQRLRVLGIVTRASRELAIAERAQFPAQRRLAERDPNLLPDPHCEILQPPANHAMDRRRRAVLHPLCHGLALAVVQLAGVPGSLAVDQAVRPAGVEPHHPARRVCSPTPPTCAALVREPPS